MRPRRAALFGVALAALLVRAGFAVPITDPSQFTSVAVVIDYLNSPVGILGPTTPVTNQYALLGILHSGQTTTPPGPLGMTSLSGLPALEAGTDDGAAQVRVDFTILVDQVGAFFAMAAPEDSMSIVAYRLDDSIIEQFIMSPAAMPRVPGPFDFNEGFIGLNTDEYIAYVIFGPAGPRNLAIVIDDLHVGASPIPEPATLSLLVLGGLGLLRRRRTR